MDMEYFCECIQQMGLANLLFSVIVVSCGLYYRFPTPKNVPVHYSIVSMILIIIFYFMDLYMFSPVGMKGFLVFYSLALTFTEALNRCLQAFNPRTSKPLKYSMARSMLLIAVIVAVLYCGPLSDNFREMFIFLYGITIGVIVIHDLKHYLSENPAEK